MARYIFHLYECGPVVADEEGSLLSGIDAARARAVLEALEIMSAEVKGGKLCRLLHRRHG